MFRFRLQQVLDLREEHERQVASQLARAMDLKHAALAQLEDLQATRLAGAEHATEAGNARSVGELTNLAYVLQQLDGQIASAEDTVHAASETVHQVQVALNAAFQDRRVLDRLRERHAEHHRVTEEQLDRRTMDEIAITRFTHTDTP